MPKKSDRPRHGSTMSNLLPNVDLDPGAPESAKDEDSTTEEQSNSTTEEQNYSSAKGQKSSATVPQDTAPPTAPMLPVHPETRPDLSSKLGPYVSDATSDALEEVFLQMRRHYGSDVSKSLIVEAALRYLLSDTLQHGTESELARWLDQTLTE